MKHWLFGDLGSTANPTERGLQVAFGGIFRGIAMADRTHECTKNACEEYNGYEDLTCFEWSNS